MSPHVPKPENGSPSVVESPTHTQTQSHTSTPSKYSFAESPSRVLDFNSAPTTPTPLPPPAAKKEIVTDSVAGSLADRFEGVLHKTPQPRKQPNQKGKALSLASDTPSPDRETEAGLQTPTHYMHVRKLDINSPQPVPPIVDSMLKTPLTRQSDSTPTHTPQARSWHRYGRMQTPMSGTVSPQAFGSPNAGKIGFARRSPAGGSPMAQPEVNGSPRHRIVYSLESLMALKPPAEFAIHRPEVRSRRLAGKRVVGMATNVLTVAQRQELGTRRRMGYNSTAQGPANLPSLLAEAQQVAPRCSAVCALPAPPLSLCILEETDEQRLKQREKQIALGKDTDGYRNYLNIIPREERSADHPHTPRASQLCGKRTFDQMVKRWRKQLHVFDSAELDINTHHIEGTHA